MSQVGYQGRVRIAGTLTSTFALTPATQQGAVLVDGARSQGFELTNLNRQDADGNNLWQLPSSDMIAVSSRDDIQAVSQNRILLPQNFNLNDGMFRIFEQQLDAIEYDQPEFDQWRNSNGVIISSIDYLSGIIAVPNIQTRLIFMGLFRPLSAIAGITESSINISRDPLDDTDLDSNGNRMRNLGLLDCSISITRYTDMGNDFCSA